MSSSLKAQSDDAKMRALLAYLRQLGQELGYPLASYKAGFHGHTLHWGNFIWVVPDAADVPSPIFDLRQLLREAFEVHLQQHAEHANQVRASPDTRVGMIWDILYQGTHYPDQKLDKIEDVLLRPVVKPKPSTLLAVRPVKGTIAFVVDKDRHTVRQAEQGAGLVDWLCRLSRDTFAAAFPTVLCTEVSQAVLRLGQRIGRQVARYDVAPEDVEFAVEFKEADEQGFLPAEWTAAKGWFRCTAEPASLEFPCTLCGQRETLGTGSEICEDCEAQKES